MNYTISLWRDGVNGIETKVLDIPRAKESPIGATTPTLTQNINGMKEFSFTLPRHYMKDGRELERNPLIDELIEESKIKLLVGEEWHDFIIKSINEEKANDQIVYACQDLASVELGKRGVEIVLNTELENNYGTVSELAEKILEHSGYSLGADSEKPYENKEEALYVMRLSADLSATRAIDSASVTLKKGDYIYLPYSSVQWNNDTNTWIKGEKYERKGYQILWKNGEVFKEEDLQEGRVVYDPDFKNNLIVADLPQDTINLAGSWYDESGSSSSIKGRFLQESVISSHEPVMNRMVEKVEVKDDSVGSPVGTIVNKYTETEYWTSETTKNLLSNSKDFTSANLWTGSGIKAKTIMGNSQHNVLYFPKTGGRFKNESLTKTGIKLTKGEKYVYAVKGLFMTPDTVELSSEGVALNQAQSVTVELFDSQKQKTVTTSTVQWTPTTNSGQEYGSAGAGVRPVNIEKGKNYVYNDYVYGLLEVNDTLDSVDFYINLGSSNTNHVFTLLEVQLFKYQLVDGKVALPEDIPSAKAIPHNYYYKIENGKEVRLASVDSAYKSLIRANYEAVRYIEVAQNSYFNNINALAEKFDMWVGFNYERDKNGAILNKCVSLYRFNPLQTTNWAGFKYGINLENIQRKADSTQITTKLVVGDNNNQFGKNGTTSIKRAKANVSKEGSIWNFDYYLNKGFLDKHKLAQDMYGYQNGDLAFITKITQINKELEPITDQIISMTADFAQSEAFLVVEQEKMKKSELELDRLQELLEQYKELLGSDSVASQSISNTEKAILKVSAHHTDALKEVARLQRLIDYYKSELYGWKDKYKGLVTKDEDIEELGIVPGNYFTIYETLRKLNSEAKTLAELLDKSSVVSKPPIILKQLYLVDKKRQLVQEFERLYHRYISEGYWNDASYLDDDVYFADAQVLSANNAFPKAEYEISLADIGLLDGYELYRFKVGDSTFVEDVEFFGSTKRVVDDVIVETPYKKAVLITESRQILDNPGQSSIVVKTYKGTYNDLITRVSYGLSNLEKELNHQVQRISETEKISTDARANRFLFENILNNVSDKINQYSAEFALELANAPGVTVDWLNKNVGVLDGNVLATNSIKVEHLKAGVMEAISAEVTLLVADALKANKAFIESLEAQFGKFDLINTGRIESSDGSSWWDLDTGEMNISKAIDGRIKHSFQVGQDGFKFVTRQVQSETKDYIDANKDQLKGEDGKDGLDGVPGKDGIGITSTTIEYAVNQSGTTHPTSGWSETVPKTNPGDYIWTKTTWKYTDNTSEEAYSVGRIGVDGPDGNDGLPGAPGVGIKKTTITYAKSTSGTVIPPSTATWSPSPPAGNPGEFIWTKTVWTYTNNETEEGYSVGMIGKTGARGAKGDKGDTGEADYTQFRKEYSAELKSLGDRINSKVSQSYFTNNNEKIYEKFTQIEQKSDSIELSIADKTDSSDVKRIFSSMTLTDKQIKSVTNSFKIESTHGLYTTYLSEGRLRSSFDGKTRMILDHDGLGMYRDNGGRAELRYARYQGSGADHFRISHKNDFMAIGYYSSGEWFNPYMLLDKYNISGYMSSNYPIQFRENVEMTENLMVSNGRKLYIGNKYYLEVVTSDPNLDRDDVLYLTRDNRRYGLALKWDKLYFVRDYKYYEIF